MSLNSYRQYFPITKTDIYLNHAAVSPLSTVVLDSVNHMMRKRSYGAIEVFPDLMEEKKTLKENLATLINTNPNLIAVIENTSAGFNWLANGLEWKEGDRILLVENEFPANIYPFMNLKRKGVAVDIATARNGFVIIDDLERKIRPETKLLSISFVGFLNGYRNQLSTIGKICQEYDIIFSVDGIQGVGALSLDVNSSNIDFLSNGGHKWLMGPEGCGFMYISPPLFERLKPAFVGWLSVKDSWDFLDYRLDLLDDSRRFEIATSNLLGIVGLRASTGLLIEAGIKNIEKHLMTLGDRLIEGMINCGYNYIGAQGTFERSGIYSFTGPDINGLLEHLKKNNVHLSTRNEVLRFAPHFYNTSEEMDQVIKICEKYKSGGKK
jgi:selenocysteine lyase/cysteine desulfurase